MGFSQKDARWENKHAVDVQTAEHNSRISNPNADAFFLHNFNDVSRNLYSLYAQWQHNYNREIGFLNWQVGTRISRIKANAQDIDTNMAMMNPNVRALRDQFNQSERAQDFSLVEAVLKTSYGLNTNIKLQLSAAIK
jgi:iron complex outermembrane receptor protein